MDEAEYEVKQAVVRLKKATEKLDQLRGKDQGPPYCSFCRRGKGQYSFLVEGPTNSRICEFCITEANMLLTMEVAREKGKV
ncbi:MAG: hypothetical protein DHS20C11_28490 [Lysobacteraceae bacterium]|nr:MAG: hypothetical protein DHS20C11_28490 [Xanthomonadaceae bacterium]